MQRKAEVISVDGNYAIVKCDRSSMCDGCHNSTCGGTCAAGMIVGNSKTMTAKAKNNAKASIGDIVEIETADSKVLRYALLVFILPIIVCAVMYGIGVSYFQNERASLALAAIGFVLTFFVVGLVEKSHSKSEPDIVITKVIKTKVD